MTAKINKTKHAECLQISAKIDKVPDNNGNR